MYDRTVADGGAPAHAQAMPARKGDKPVAQRFKHRMQGTVRHAFQRFYEIVRGDGRIGLAGGRRVDGKRLSGAEAYLLGVCLYRFRQGQRRGAQTRRQGADGSLERLCHLCHL
jgi:hypothetical protein